jgi:nondiscriminating aspartyl-tRNA synthetase
MKRTLIKETPNLVDQKVLLSGWVSIVRDHGKITFVDIKDRSGVIQCIGQNVPKVLPEYVVNVVGTVVKRPEKLVNGKLPTGSVELQIESLDVVTAAEELPIDMGKETLDLQLPTLLDLRTLTLRHPKTKKIFKVQEAVMEGFRKAAHDIDCTEVFVPTISASSTEGGAEVFKVKYYEHETYMIQSPQLYKQMMVPVFERVFLTSHAYRAEPSITTRHLSESIQLDCELGFVSFDELLDALEFVGTETLKYVENLHGDILEEYGVEKLRVYKKVPRLTMREAQEIIKKRTGVDHTNEPDLMPEDEREICRWAVEEHDSDLVTITHYPTKKRAFYTLPDPKNPEFSLSYDLLFRGLEILSGSQRIHDYNDLVTAIEGRGMNPDNFKMYLQAFKYGMPPEGGFSFGLERLTMQILQLANVREASLFPRDMERVDFRFTSVEKSEEKTS